MSSCTSRARRDDGAARVDLFDDARRHGDQSDLRAFILLPSLITTYAIALQAHPQYMMRMTGAIAAAVAIVVPAVLEWVGALPSSYVFEHNTWMIVPQLVELPRLGTNVFLTVAHLGMIVIPCLFIAKLREELNRAQLRLAVQAWQWKRVISSTHAGMP